MASPEDRAQRLKLQGNALHEKGEHQAAYDKYTEAIKEDPQNAVLYANRSAASLSMKEQQNLIQNTERLGQGWQLRPSKCFDAWEAAFASLPSQDLTAGQKALQAQFQDGLKASKAAEAKPPPPTRLVAVAVGRNGHRNAIGKMPWVRAAALEKKVLAAQQHSSVIVLLYASRVNSLIHPTCSILMGHAIEAMSNGILIDRRCFYMDGKEWMHQYLEQVDFEGQYYQAWGKGGSKIVIEQAPGRLAAEGWDKLGPALCVTVRLWIMQGFICGSTGSQRVATEYFRSALDIIEWGCKTWSDVPRSMRGDIFDITFMRSVRRLFVAAAMDWVDLNDPECDYTPQDVAKFAQDMIKELLHNTPERTNEDQYHPNHPGHYVGSWIYPHADALGVLGWFHMKLSKTAQTVEDEKIHLTAAARNYMESADTYPADDEFSVFFRSIALDTLLLHGTPLRRTLPICKQIRSAIPAMIKIWEHSAMSKRRDVALQEVLDWEREAQKGLLAGTLTPGSEVGRTSKV
ncbi:hypothetical protein DFH06DRAFT_995832 [Mycena polygramma]|nr:hypothetical protein DFH06DRAFT_995832 [Mycena polygramma]